MRTLISLASLAALAAIAAGCQSGPMERRGGPVAATPTGVEGSWIDDKGVGISTFAGGTFTTVAADTESKLSEGSYRYDPGSRTASIEVRSIIRGTVSNVNCALATPSQLNCTSSSGNRFILVRRVATS